MIRPIGFEVKMSVPVAEATGRVEEALRTQGFGVLTRIDVKRTLKEKLDVDFREYAILGACNPRLAHRVLSRRAEAGLLLPCNVTVEESGDGGSVVRIGDPDVMLGAAGLDDDSALAHVAAEARRLLRRAADSLTEPALAI